MLDTIYFKKQTGPGSLVFTFLNFRKSNSAVVTPHVIPQLGLFRALQDALT